MAMTANVTATADADGCRQTLTPPLTCTNAHVDASRSAEKRKAHPVHNPEVAGSNPAPATSEVTGQRPFLPSGREGFWRRGQRMVNIACLRTGVNWTGPGRSTLAKSTAVGTSRCIGRVTRPGCVNCLGVKWSQVQVLSSQRCISRSEGRSAQAGWPSDHGDCLSDCLGSPWTITDGCGLSRTPGLGGPHSGHLRRSKGIVTGSVGSESMYASRSSRRILRSRSPIRTDRRAPDASRWCHSVVATVLVTAEGCWCAGC